MLMNETRFWDPWQELSKMQRDLERIFGLRRDSAGTLTMDSPNIRIYRTTEGAIVTMELPGLDPNEFDLSVNGDTLTIKGKRNGRPENVRFHRQERMVGDITRVVQLPFRVDPHSAKATYERGILSVHLTHHEEERPKRIPISTV